MAARTSAYVLYTSAPEAVLHSFLSSVYGTADGVASAHGGGSIAGTSRAELIRASVRSGRGRNRLARTRSPSVRRHVAAADGGANVRARRRG